MKQWYTQGQSTHVHITIKDVNIHRPELFLMDADRITRSLSNSRVRTKLYVNITCLYEGRKLPLILNFFLISTFEYGCFPRSNPQPQAFWRVSTNKKDWLVCFGLVCFMLKYFLDDDWFGLRLNDWRQRFPVNSCVEIKNNDLKKSRKSERKRKKKLFYGYVWSVPYKIYLLFKYTLIHVSVSEGQG